jgi:hypothetical protein
MSFFTRATHLMTRLFLTAAACCALTGMPVQAQGINITINLTNWYENHNQWDRWCYSEPRHGHWGREGRYDRWCADNRRFRDTHPDKEWQHRHPWDKGHDGDGDH